MIPQQLIDTNNVAVPFVTPPTVDDSVINTEAKKDSVKKPAKKTTKKAVSTRAESKHSLIRTLMSHYPPASPTGTKMAISIFYWAIGHLARRRTFEQPFRRTRE